MVHEIFQNTHKGGGRGGGGHYTYTRDAFFFFSVAAILEAWGFTVVQSRNIDRVPRIIK